VDTDLLQPGKSRYAFGHITGKPLKVLDFRLNLKL
jgi:hypothetical protein